MYTFQALQILIFLIPGLISAAILDRLVVREKTTELGKIIEALIFSMLIYTIHSIIFGKSPVVVNQIKTTIVYLYDGKAFVFLALLSFVIPVIFGLFITNDWHMGLARRIGISRRTARSSVWFDTFCDKRKHVIINFEDGRRIWGWPLYYSDNPENPYIYLFKPALIDSKLKFDRLDIDGILITPVQKIESIMFLDK